MAERCEQCGYLETALGHQTTCLSGGGVQTAANARRAQAKADNIARYVAVADLPDAVAAAALGFSIHTVRKYRIQLLASGQIKPHRKGVSPTKPCGTVAAYKRHRRNGEEACAECLAAEARRGADSKGRTATARILTPDYRDKRNNLPERPYTWRSQRYRWAEQALARAEAVWGTPDDEAIAS